VEKKKDEEGLHDVFVAACIVELSVKDYIWQHGPMDVDFLPNLVGYTTPIPPFPPCPSSPFTPFPLPLSLSHPFLHPISPYHSRPSIPKS